MSLETAAILTAAPAAEQTSFRLTAPAAARAQMRVTKRNGAREPVDVNKIVRAVTRCCEGLADVDPMLVALKTIAGLYDGATTRELDELSIRTAASFMFEEPEYSRLAARLLAGFIDKEVQGSSVHSFSQSIRVGFDVGLINERVADFVEAHARKLNDAIDNTRTQEFEYFGLRTLYDRYLLKHPTRRHVLETPQHFWMRIAVALSATVPEAIELYQQFSSLDYIASSPTLFNAGTCHEQLSSCFLLDSPLDSLESIYDKYKDVALLSKFSGGIGMAWHRVRSEGSLIRATNGMSNGIVPWLKTLDSSVAAVNQGGKRKGAACAYLEPWHADVFEFLELKKNHGKEEMRARDLFYAMWIPDLFMKRVESNDVWSLFCPNEAPGLADCYGDDFERLYEKYEKEGRFRKQIKAQDLWFEILEAQIETGTPYILYKDAANKKSNQKNLGTIKSSNLCTEIMEFSSPEEVAVCNLASLALPKFVTEDGKFDHQKLYEITKVVTRNLNKVIDVNYYPIPEAQKSNLRHRPIGLGVQGLADAFIAATALEEDWEFVSRNVKDFQWIADLRLINPFESLPN